MAKYKESPDVKFPVATLEWPYLNAPDTKFNASGEYKTNLRLPLEDVEDIIKTLEGYRDEEAEAERERLNSVTGPGAGKAKAAAKALELKPVFTPAYDDEGNETGEVIFKTIRRAFKDKTTGKMVLLKPVLVDAKRSPIDSPVWGGSKALVNATPRPYVMDGKVGVSLRLKGTQVTELVSGGGSAAAGSMFDEQDGYVEPVKDTPDEVVTPPNDDQEWA